MKISYLLCTAAIAGLAVAACGNGKKPTETVTQEVVKVERPAFSGDSAFAFVEKQVAFGPRVPNTTSHQQCGDYLVTMLRQYGAQVTEQAVDLTAYSGKTLHARNIIGSYLPDAVQRILLFAHWDTRPFADQDAETHHKTPIDGANDGASGVGVLLEIARQLQQKLPAVGVDIIFFDAEDYGEPEGTVVMDMGNTWCLGSQYWGRIPHQPDYHAKFGILLDMVGAPNATFYYEGYSRRTAPTILQQIWDNAQALGHGKYFIQKDGFEVTDDHIFVHYYRQIPSVDIIHYDEKRGGFNHTWHTLKDNMSNIDRATLQAVGETVLATVYQEKP